MGFSGFKGRAVAARATGRTRAIFFNRLDMKEECVSDFVRLKGKVYPCPLSLAMDLVGGKWKAVILYHLQDGAKRFAELHRHLLTATEATLSQQLKQLEEDGLISRAVFGDKPPLRTEYALTDFGRSFVPVLTALLQWGNGVVAARGERC